MEKTIVILLVAFIAILLLDLVALYVLSVVFKKREEKEQARWDEIQSEHAEMHQSLGDAMRTLSSQVKEVLAFFTGFENVCSDFSETIRKERIQYYALKDAHKKLIEQTKSSTLQKMLDISNAQVEALRRDIEEYKSKSEKGESCFPPFNRYFENDEKQVLKDDREANKKLALEIQKRKKHDPFGIIKMHELGKEDKPAPEKKEKKKKFSYHAYNTPERMKELRRLKALKKQGVITKSELIDEITKINETTKKRVGRPKGSKNKI